MAHPRIAPEIEKTIVELCSAGKTNREVAALYGITDSGVTKVLRRNGIARRDKLSPELEQAIVASLRTGKGVRETAAIHGVSASGVSNIRRRMDLPAPKIGRPATRTVDHAAFDVSTPETCYWMGFLCADGTVSFNPDGAPQIILALGIKDRGHVDKFRTFLKSDHAITDVLNKAGTIRGHLVEERKSCTFGVRSTQLTAALATHGLATKSPDRVPDDTLATSPDFWRGCIDGDGTVRINLDKRRNYEYASLILCGHIPLLEKYQTFLSRMGIAANITDTASGIYQIRLMGSGALAVIKSLYGNATVALDRKLATAREILNRFDH